MNRKEKSLGIDKSYATLSQFLSYSRTMLYKHNRCLVFGLVLLADQSSPKALVFQNIGDENGLDLKLLCFDPSSHSIFDSQMNKITASIRESFGKHIKEAWWGGWRAHMASDVSDEGYLGIVCWFIRSLAIDGSKMPSTPEAIGYVSCLSAFHPQAVLALRPKLE